MSTAPKKTTLTLDDIQMIGDLVQQSVKDSEERILSKVVSKDEYVFLIKSAVGEVVEEKFKEVIGNYPSREKFHFQMATQAKTVEKVEQEQIVLTHQVQRIDKRITILEKKAHT